VPVKPSGPNRPLLDSLVLLAALAAGLGIAVLMAQLHPTFTNRETLQKLAGIPVLGSISAAIRDEFIPWYRRQLVLVAGATALLLVVYGLNILLTEPLRAVLRQVV
jgi:hypothetical protein